MPIPFDGKIFGFTNPDGSAVTVRGWGDQHYAVFEDLDGFTVTKDPETGYYHYARLSDDAEQLVAMSARVGETDPVDLGLVRRIRIKSAAAKRAAAASAGPVDDPRRWVVRRAERRAQRLTDASSLADRDLGPPPAQTVGTYLGLCVLIDFPDVAGTITNQQVTDFCNRVGYHGFGNNGSVRDYFHEVSDGKLTYTNLVTHYYTAANPRSHYTDPSVSFGTRARELITEALNHLRSSGFNFSPLSSDSDGFIYALNVFYAGELVNNWSEGLWPHAWALASPFDVGGGKRLNDYQITNMGSELTLRTFCHENGHMICDFPDLYDYGGESMGPGHFCLMGYGGNDKNPTQVDAYLKHAAGWTSSITTIVPGMSGAVTAGVNDFYIHRKGSTEYFILENRQQTGRDASLPDHGLAIWHIDELGSNNNEQMTPTQHYECALKQADGRFDLESNANSGDAEDLFSAPSSLRFADDTTPSSRWWDGTSSGLIVRQVSASAPTMTFMTGPGGDDSASYWLIGSSVGVF